jgi:hypothetical protein
MLSLASGRTLHKVLFVICPERMRYITASIFLILAAAVVVLIIRPWHALPAPASPAGTRFSVVHSPDGVLVQDTRGAWLFSRRRPGSDSSDVVIGLPDRDGYPSIPSNPFGTGDLNVKLSTNISIGFSPASTHHVLLITYQGCMDAPHTPSDAEIAATIDSVSAERSSIPAAASQLAAVRTGR